MKYNKQIICFLLAGVVTVQIIGMLLPFTGDAGKYAAVSKNIFLDHDFFNLKIHGSPYYQKPPLLMWLSSAGYFLFGEANNFTTRLFPLLFSLLMLYATYRIGKLFYNKKTAKTAALFMGTTQIYFLYNTDLHTDVILATCTTLAIWLLAEYIEKRKWYHFVLGFTAIGMAMLTKGPIGLAVPVFAVGTHLLMKKNFKMIFRAEWLAGIAIVFILIFPYLKALYDSSGWNGLRFFFWTNNAGRISGTYRSNNIDPAFYIYNLLVFTLPWSLFYFGGLVKQLIGFFSKRQNKLTEYYTVGGSVILIIILSFSRMKSPNYFYPAIPLLSIPAASYFQGLLEKQLKFHRFLPHAVLVQNLLMWGAVLFIVLYLFPVKNVLIWIDVALLCTVFILESIEMFSERGKILITALVSVIALNFIINAHVLPQMFQYQASLKAAKIYNREADDNAVFYTYRYAQFEMFFYAKTKGYKIKDEGIKEEPFAVNFEDAIEKRDAWFLADRYSYEQIKRKSSGIEKVYEFDHFYLTGINWKFLNPKTRESSLQKIYLVETKK